MRSIDDRYTFLGGARSVLGLSIGEDRLTLEGRGIARDYEHGSIYWTPITGAYEIVKDIKDKWLEQGGEQGSLGYPVSGEVIAPDGTGRISYFESGSIYWSLATGARILTNKMKCIHLHTKAVFGKSKVVQVAVDAAQVVFASIGIKVEHLSFEIIDSPDLEDLDVGGCLSGRQLTTEQFALFGQRNSVGPSDIVAYFVRTISTPANGCSVCPEDSPGVVVAAGADQWALAHELGHLLGLSHINDDHRLMNSGGTSGIVDPPPDLGPSEVVIIFNQGLVVQC